MYLKASCYKNLGKSLKARRDYRALLTILVPDPLTSAQLILPLLREFK